MKISSRQATWEGGNYGGGSYSGKCKVCGKAFSYSKTGTPGEEQDACKAGYCSVACENSKTSAYKIKKQDKEHLTVLEEVKDIEDKIVKHTVEDTDDVVVKNKAKKLAYLMLIIKRAAEEDNGHKSCKFCSEDFDAAGGKGYLGKYCSSECAAKDGNPKARVIHPEIKEQKY